MCGRLQTELFSVCRKKDIIKLYQNMIGLKLLNLIGSDMLNLFVKKAGDRMCDSLDYSFLFL